MTRARRTSSRRLLAAGSGAHWACWSRSSCSCGATASRSPPSSSIPLMQLVLFGYAINTTPRNLPTAVLLQESSDVGRSILKALENTKYFKVTRQVARRGRVRPRAGVRRGAVRDRDPGELRARAAARRPAGAAGRRRRHRSGGDRLGARRAQQIVQTALRNDRAHPRQRPRRRSRSAPTPATTRRHRRQLNIVPGLIGTILTLTMLIFTALSVTREIERGTMESLLSMPITPVEIMLGKIVPYVLVGFVQAALIVGVGVVLFDVPIVGNLRAAGAADARCSSPPICRSATRSRRWRRTSCRPCRCR